MTFLYDGCSGRHCRPLTYLLRLDLGRLYDVSVSSLDGFRHGAHDFSIELEEHTVPLEAGIHGETRQLEHHVAGVASGVRVELGFQSMHQFAVVRRVHRFFVALLQGRGSLVAGFVLDEGVYDGILLAPVGTATRDETERD